MVIVVEFKKYVVRHLPGALIIIYIKFAYLGVKNSRKKKAEFQILIRYIDGNQN